MSRIFISYRRGDTAPYAGRLHDKLSLRFGPENVFRDIDDIQPGADFVDVIKQSVRQCDATLVLIGADWLTISDEDGVRRLDQPNDFIRLEVGAALASSIPVIPILVEETVMPSADELPEALVPLSTRNAVKLTDERFDYDFEKLAAALDGYLDGGRRRSDPAGRSKTKLAQAAGALLLVALLIVAVNFFLGNDPAEPAPAPPLSGMSEEARRLVAINPIACLNSSPDLPANETLSISSPASGEEVAATPSVSGTAALGEGESLFFFVYATSPCEYYFDPYEPVQPGDDGRWEHQPNITENNGKKVILVAAVVGPNNRALFEEVLNDFRSRGRINEAGVKRFPAGTKVARVSVRIEP